MGLVNIGTIYKLMVTIMLDDPDMHHISAQETFYVINAPDAIAAFECIEAVVHEWYEPDSGQMLPSAVKFLIRAEHVTELPTNSEFIVYVDRGQREAAR